MINSAYRILAVVLVGLCSGCSSMLPSGKEVVKSPWNSFDEAQASFDQIFPNETTVEELSQLGFAPPTRRLTSRYLITWMFAGCSSMNPATMHITTPG